MKEQIILSKYMDNISINLSMKPNEIADKIGISTRELNKVLRKKDILKSATKKKSIPKRFVYDNMKEVFIPDKDGLYYRKTKQSPLEFKPKKEKKTVEEKQKQESEEMKSKLIGAFNDKVQYPDIDYNNYKNLFLQRQKEVKVGKIEPEEDVVDNVIVNINEEEVIPIIKPIIKPNENKVSKILDNFSNQPTRINRYPSQINLSNEFK